MSPHRGDGLRCGSCDDVYAGLLRRNIDTGSIHSTSRAPTRVTLHTYAPTRSVFDMSCMSCPVPPLPVILRPRQQHGTSGAQASPFLGRQRYLESREPEETSVSVWESHASVST